MAAYAGQGGNVVFGMNTYHVDSWNFDDGCEPLDVSTTNSNFFRQVIEGMSQGKGSFKGWGTDGNAIASGDTGTGTFTLGESGDSIACTEIFVTSMKLENPATDRVSFEASFVTSGSYTMP
jgi:hypothetical protein